MPAARIKIAFIDDSVTVRQILSQTLAGAGYDPIECASWEQLLDAMQQRPALVLVDLQMPHHSGAPMVFVLKKQHPEVKVLYYSSAKTSVLRKLAAETGADGFVRKRWDCDELLETIARVVGP
jgi:two-component system, chemotaxis family, chemotaxis protein CheY